MSKLAMLRSLIPFLAISAASLAGIGAIAMANAAKSNDGPTDPVVRSATGNEQEHAVADATNEEDVMPETAIFAGGCFWGVELRFSQIPGVLDVVSGYIGGAVDDPTYRQVCSEDTGHAEAVRVTFDPEKVTYEALLEAFWHCHDPTTVDRQGPDVGSQYRSAIFASSPEQRAAAEESLAAMQASEAFREAFGDRKIVTQIVDSSTFYPAEDYHQDYFAKKGVGTCHRGW